MPQGAPTSRPFLDKFAKVTQCCCGCDMRTAVLTAGILQFVQLLPYIVMLTSWDYFILGSWFGAAFTFMGFLNLALCALLITGGIMGLIASCGQGNVCAAASFFYVTSASWFIILLLFIMEIVVVTSLSELGIGDGSGAMWMWRNGASMLLILAAFRCLLVLSGQVYWAICAASYVRELEHGRPNLVHPGAQSTVSTPMVHTMITFNNQGGPTGVTLKEGVITAVTPGGYAHSVGVQAGFHVTAFNNAPVHPTGVDQTWTAVKQTQQQYTVTFAYPQQPQQQIVVMAQPVQPQIIMAQPAFPGQGIQMATAIPTPIATS